MPRTRVSLMNINILRYSLFGIAGGQEVDRNFSQIYYLPSYNDCIINTSDLGNLFNSAVGFDGTLTKPGRDLTKS